MTAPAGEILETLSTDVKNAQGIVTGWCHVGSEVTHHKPNDAPFGLEVVHITLTNTILVQIEEVIGDTLSEYLHVFAEHDQVISRIQRTRMDQGTSLASRKPRGKNMWLFGALQSIRPVGILRSDRKGYRPRCWCSRYDESGAASGVCGNCGVVCGDGYREGSWPGDYGGGCRFCYDPNRGNGRK
jgi:hypothetical protein